VSEGTERLGVGRVIDIPGDREDVGPGRYDGDGAERIVREGDGAERIVRDGDGAAPMVRDGDGDRLAGWLRPEMDGPDACDGRAGEARCADELPACDWPGDPPPRDGGRPKAVEPKSRATVNTKVGAIEYRRDVPLKDANMAFSPLTPEKRRSGILVAVHRNSPAWRNRSEASQWKVLRILGRTLRGKINTQLAA